MTDENRLSVIIIIISRIYHNMVRGFLGTLSGSPQFIHFYKVAEMKLFIFAELGVRLQNNVASRACASFSNGVASRAIAYF